MLSSLLLSFPQARSLFHSPALNLSSVGRALYGELVSSNGHLTQQRCAEKKTCVNVKHVCACPENEASDT